MFLAPLDLSFHTATRLAPLAHSFSHFFVAALVGQLFVLVMEPHLLEFLLLQVRCRKVRKVAGDALKLVSRGVLRLLFIVRVECLELWLVLSSLNLRKNPCRAAELDLTTSLS